MYSYSISILFRLDIVIILVHLFICTLGSSFKCTPVIRIYHTPRVQRSWTATMLPLPTIPMSIYITLEMVCIL